MTTTVYLLVRIAWAVGKVLYEFVQKNQAVMSADEKKEWKRHWTEDFRSGE